MADISIDLGNPTEKIDLGAMNAEASKISDTAVEKAAQTGDVSKLDAAPTKAEAAAAPDAKASPDSGSLGADIFSHIDRVEVTVGINESVVQDRSLLNADEAKAYLDILKETKEEPNVRGREDIFAEKAGGPQLITSDIGLEGKTQLVSSDPERPRITSDALVSAAQRARSKDNFDVNTIDFKRGGILDNISTFKDKTPDQAMADVRLAVETFKERHPNASASMISEVTKKVSGIMEGLINDPVKGRSETYIRDINGKTAGQLEFQARAENMRASDMKSNFRTQAIDHSSNTLKDTEGSFNKSLASIDQNPDNLESEVKTFSSNYIRNAKIAGVSNDKIKETLGARVKEATIASVKARIRSDPYAAQTFIEGNTERLGKNAASLLKSAQSSQKQLESKRSEVATARQLKEATSFLPPDLKSLREIEKTEGIEGQAAQKQLALFRKDPQKFAEDAGVARFNSLDTADPATIRDRIASVKIASQEIGENIPILNKEEIAAVKDSITDTRTALDFISLFKGAEISDRHRIAQQFHDSALGTAIIHNDTAVQRDIVAGLSSDAKIDRERLPQDRLAFPMDSARNRSANLAIDALIRTGKYSEEEATKTVTNKQTVGGSLRRNQGLLGALFGGGYEVPLPYGTTAEQFDSTTDSILSSEALIKQYGNGEPKKLRTPTGAFVTLDPDEVRWVPTTGGKYALFNGKGDDAEPIVKENGALFEIRLEEAMRPNTGALKASDPSNDIENDLRAASGLPRR